MMYPAISISVSSVSCVRPAFDMRLSLSSSRTFIPVDALHSENTPSGSNAESPYFLFLSKSRSCISLHLIFILSFVFIYG